MNSSRCHLHVPHKDWNSFFNREERENYLSIERWSRDYLRRYATLNSTRSTPLNIPHKAYADQLELENYEVIENWVYQRVPASLGQTIHGMSRYDLHIPHKSWSDDKLELENYLAIERWAARFIRECLPLATGGS